MINQVPLAGAGEGQAAGAAHSGLKRCCSLRGQRQTWRSGFLKDTHEESEANQLYLDSQPQHIQCL